MTGRLHFHFPLSCTGEGNGNPLQCACLEIPRDGGAWWAAVYGVAQSWTRLKRLSCSSSVLFISVCSLVLLGLLVNISYIFSIFASILSPRSWIICTVIILNYFFLKVDYLHFISLFSGGFILPLHLRHNFLLFHHD